MVDKIDWRLWAIRRKLAVAPPLYSQSGKRFRIPVSKPDDSQGNYLPSDLFFKSKSFHLHLTTSLELRTARLDALQISSNTNISFTVWKHWAKRPSQWAFWIHCFEDALLSPITVLPSLPIWKRKGVYKYIYDWVTLLYSRNWHNVESNYALIFKNLQRRGVVAIPWQTWTAPLRRR